MFDVQVDPLELNDLLRDGEFEMSVREAYFELKNALFELLETDGGFLTECNSVQVF